MTQWRNPQAEVPVEGLESFYDEFLATRLDELALLSKQLEARNAESVRQMVHKWKGFCAPYGFGELGLLAQEMEVAVLAGDFSLCQQLYVKMGEYLSSKQRN